MKINKGTDTKTKERNERRVCNVGNRAIECRHKPERKKESHQEEEEEKTKENRKKAMWPTIVASMCLFMTFYYCYCSRTIMHNNLLDASVKFFLPNKNKNNQTDANTLITLKHLQPEIMIIIIIIKYNNCNSSIVYICIHALLEIISKKKKT